MTKQASARWLFLAFSVALTNLNAADPASDHTWQTRINERLDTTIARLEAEGKEHPAGLLALTAGEGNSGPVATPSLMVQSQPERQGHAAVIGRLLEDNGLPPALASVVAVESAFNPLALSPKGARGLWQLMPETARRYGLNVQPDADERTDPVKSTNAAAAYFKDLYTLFRDWPLALAAYNAGEDRVMKAMARTGARDFWSLRRRAALPEETLQYVPAVLTKLESPLQVPLFEASLPDMRTATNGSRGRLAYASTAPN